jgi:hypothetical protein
MRLRARKSRGKKKEEGKPLRRLGFNTLNKKNEGKKSFNLLHFRAHKCSIKHTRKTTMVRDVDNHGHKIWSPFSSGGIHSPIDGNASKNTFNDAQKMEFVLHANIIHSVRVYVLSVVYARRISLPLSLLCVCVFSFLTTSFVLLFTKQEYFQNALVPTEDIDDLIDEIYNEVSN